MAETVQELHDRLRAEIVARHTETLASGRQVASTSRTVAAHVERVGKPIADGSFQARVTPLVMATVGSHAPAGRVEILNNPQPEQRLLTPAEAVELERVAEVFCGQKVSGKMPLTLTARLAFLKPIIQGLRSRLGAVNGQYED